MNLVNMSTSHIHIRFGALTVDPYYSIEFLLGISSEGHISIIFSISASLNSKLEAFYYIRKHNFLHIMRSSKPFWRILLNTLPKLLISLQQPLIQTSLFAKLDITPQLMEPRRPKNNRISLS